MNNVDRPERRGTVTLTVYLGVFVLMFMTYVGAYLMSGMKFERTNFIRRMYSRPTIAYAFYPVAWADSVITGRSVSVGLISGHPELYRFRGR